jgi:hypothetical protein
MSDYFPSNEEIAAVLDRIADLLEAEDANPHRVRAYRNGAERVRNSKTPLAQIVAGGDGDALQELPGIAEGLAGVITSFVRTGRSDVLTRLQTEVPPERLFARVPGIGEVLAKRIVRQLEIDTLEELEQAAHSGRLYEVEGIGPKRVQSAQVSLAGMLNRSALRRAQERAGNGGRPPRARPDVGVLLQVDAEYRRKAEAGELLRIAPKRFNPEGEAWLPILRTTRDRWDFTALYSNTARAHELNKTRDWVVIYYKLNGRDGREDQATVVTATRGKLEGKRIVRGREAECEQYYKSPAEA